MQDEELISLFNVLGSLHAMSKRKKLTCSGTSGHTLLLDGDVLIFRIACTTENESEELVKVRMNSYIDEIFFNSFCSDYRVFLSDNKEGNFRYKIHPEYKAGRPQKPKHYSMLREYLISHEKAEVAFGQEADDLIGIEQTSNTVAGHNDKDINMIPGKHFDFTKNKHYEISNAQGRHNFWCQMLTGDWATDRIPGIRGIGPKKAEKILNGCSTDRDYLAAVCSAYEDLTDIPCVITHLDWLGKLLFIRREHNQMWSVYG